MYGETVNGYARDEETALSIPGGCSWLKPAQSQLQRQRKADETK